MLTLSQPTLGKFFALARLHQAKLARVPLMRLVLLLCFLQPAQAAQVFDFATVKALAAQKARAPYQAPPPLRPEFLSRLTYDQYRDIRFRPELALWKSIAPFQVQFFHPGFYFKQAVVVNVIDEQGVHRVPFAPKLFDYGKNRFPEDLPADLGFAGFRLHAPMNRADYYDEVAVFLGASYFRAIGEQQHYGLSARGLAIDTATPGASEEFPWFREFWLQRPAPGAKSMTVYALLDGPSVSGAYEFVIHPGAATVMEVKASVYLRRPVAKLGMAPLTSMFLHGPINLAPSLDYRPQVHDSDGLLIAAGSGEWIWRPLSNVGAVQVASFQDQDPKGFGLLQRDRNFDHYQDLEAHYQSRPSAWVEPLGPWGKGQIQLVEIPSKEEINDNIVAYWLPEHAPAAGQSLDFAYRLYWYQDAARPPAAYTAATRVAAASVPGGRKFVLDFAGGALPRLGSDAQVSANITVGESGRLVEATQFVEKNPQTGGWRVVFEVQPRTPHAPVEMRVFLQRGKEVLSETWSYLWNS